MPQLERVHIRPIYRPNVSDHYSINRSYCGFWAYQLLLTWLFPGHERFNHADLSWGGLPQFNRYALPQSDSRMRERGSRLFDLGCSDRNNAVLNGVVLIFTSVFLADRLTAFD